MTGASTPQKTNTGRIFAIIGVLLLLGSIGPMPFLSDDVAAQGGAAPTIDVSDDVVHGHGATVTFTVALDDEEDEPPSEINLGQNIRAQLSPGQDVDNHIWVGHIFFAPSGSNAPAGANHVTVSSSTLERTLQTPTSIGTTQDSVTVTWHPTNDLEIISANPEDRIIWGDDDFDLEVKDSDFPPQSEAEEPCTGDEPLFRYSIDGGHNWEPLAPTNCEVVNQNQKHLRFEFSGHEIDGETEILNFQQVLVAVQDERGQDGKETARIATFTFRETSEAPTIDLFTSDLVHLADDAIGTGQYLLRIKDPAADVNGTHPGKLTGGPDRIQATVSTSIHDNTIELTETGADTGEFQAQLNVRTSVSDVDNLILVRNQGDIIDVSYKGATADWGWNQVVPSEFSTTPSSTAIFGTVSSIPTNPDDEEGGVLKITGPDGAKLVIRAGHLYEEECTAASFETADNSDDPGCRTLTLSGSGEGHIFFVPKGNPNEISPDANEAEAVLEVNHQMIFWVEYREEDLVSDPRDQVVLATAHQWIESFDASISLNRDSYYVGETVEVRLVDPDQTSGSTRTVTLVRDTEQAPHSQLVELTRIQGEPGSFEGSIVLGSGSQEFPVSDGEEFYAEYDDTRDATGVAANNVPSQPAMALEDPTGQITASDSVVAGTDGFTLTIDDSEAAGTPSAMSEAPFRTSPLETIRFQEDGQGIFTATVRSAYDVFETVAPSASEEDGSAPSGFGLGRCWFEVDLGGPFEPYGLSVTIDGEEWDRDLGPGENSNEYGARYADGSLVINNPDPDPPVLPTDPDPDCSYRNFDDITVEFIPAPVLTQSFIMDGATDVLPLARHVSPLVEVTAGFDPELIDEDTDRPIWLGDTTPQQNGQTAGTYTRLFNACGSITINVVGSGDESCDSVDSQDAEVTLDGIPEEGAVVTITYRVSATIVQSSGSGLNHFPMLPGTLLMDGEPADLSEVNEEDLTSLVSDGTLPAGDCTSGCTYRTDLYHDNHVGYGVLLNPEVNPPVTFNYASNDIDVKTRVLVAPGGPTSLVVRDNSGHESQYIFGRTSTGLIEFNYPAGNSQPAAIDTATVEVTARAVSGDGLGDVLETDTISLTEEGLSSGRFVGDLTFEASQTGNNGVVYIGTADSVQLEIVHADSDSSQTVWFFRTSTATMQLTGDDFAGSVDIPISVNEPDAKNLHVGLIEEWTTSEFQVPVDLRPISVSSAIVYACEDEVGCQALIHEVGDPGAVPDEDGHFRANSAGEFRVAAPEDVDPDFIRIDFRSLGSSDDVVHVDVEIFTPGNVEHETIDLTRSGTSSTFEPSDDFGALLGDLNEPAEIKFIYQDGVYATIDGEEDCDAAAAPDCPLNNQRFSSGASNVVKSAAWRPSDTGDISVKIRGGEATIDSLVLQNEVVHVAIDDIDRNADSAALETVQAVLERSDGATRTITLRETGLESATFEAYVRPTDELSGWSPNHGFTIRYNDPAGDEGNAIPVRYLDSESFIPWSPAESGNLRIHDEIANLEGQVQFSVSDMTLEDGDDESFRVFKTSRNGSPVFSGESVDLVDSIGSPEEEEGVFTWTLSLDNEEINPLITTGHEYHVAYLDEADSQGFKTTSIGSFEVLPDNVGIPSFDQDSYMDEGSLITVTVEGAPGNSEVEIFFRAFDAQSWNSAGPLTLSGESKTFSVQPTSGVTTLDIPFNSEIVAVYRDGQGFWTTDRSTLGVIGDFIPTSEAEIISGTLGENEWYVTPPTIEITAVENAGRLDFFEYQINDGGTEDCNAPCSVTLNAEGENIFGFRAVDISGAREVVDGSFHQMTVPFDETPPDETVTGLEALSRPEGAIEIVWNSTVDDTFRPTEFSEFAVFVGEDADPIGNSSSKSFTHTPPEDGEYDFSVAIKDAAGHLGPVSDLVSGISDRIAPELESFNVTPQELREELGETTVTTTLTVVDEPENLQDIDRVFLRVIDPFGAEQEEVNMDETDSTTWTLQYSDFTECGVYQLFGVAADAVGNEGRLNHSIRYVAIDDQAPRVVGLADEILQGSDLNVTVRDNCAGLESVSYSIDGGDSRDVSIPTREEGEPCEPGPCEVFFQIPADRLSVGENQISFVLTDANETANEAVVTMTVLVVVPEDPVDPPDITTPPSIGDGSSLVELGGRFSFTVSGGTPTSLTFEVDGLVDERSVLNGLDAATGLVRVDVGELEPGPHEAIVRASNPSGNDRQTFDFYVLDSGVPLPPQNVRVEEDENGRPVVTWEASPSEPAKVGGYLVHRASSPWAVIGVTDANTLSFTDLTALGSRNYQYAVTTFGPNGEGSLEPGADSEESLPWFQGVQATTFETSNIDEGVPNWIWWGLLVVLAVLVVVSLVYVNRQAIFGRKPEHLYAQDTVQEQYPDEAAEHSTPFGEEQHMIRCPNCSDEFHVSGERPVVTACPNCGRKGILR